MQSSRTDKIFAILLAMLATLWAGLVAGVSFFATPVKFQTPGLSLPVAIGIGKYTFHVSQQAQWGIAVIVVTLIVLGGWKGYPLLFSGVAIACLLLQTVWLLPFLDRRADLFIAGNPQPDTYQHTVFGVVEVAKFLSLLAASYAASAGLTRNE